MKLHTDFKDYYDTAVGYGIDTNVHYNRYTQEVEVKFDAESDIPTSFWGATPFLLGFCGCIYPMSEIKRFDENYKFIDKAFAYTYEEMINLQIKWEKVTHNEKQAKNQIKQFFENWSKEDDKIFKELKTPVWLIELNSYNQKAIINPRLETYEFYRIKDALTAFQEISMYLSNVLIEQKETAVIEDKYRITQHGFDSKKSFRKEKQK